ncbi:transposase, partial [Elizabethkingia argentiflava]|nr:transposase [Elizabethkingia argenteiflava]
RIIWNSILYLVKTGCQWRMLPQDFPKWQRGCTIIIKSVQIWGNSN